MRPAHIHNSLSGPRSIVFVTNLGKKHRWSGQPSLEHSTRRHSNHTARHPQTNNDLIFYDSRTQFGTQTNEVITFRYVTAQSSMPSHNNETATLTFVSKVPFRTRKRLKNSDIRNCFISFARRKDDVSLSRLRASFRAEDGHDSFELLFPSHFLLSSRCVYPLLIRLRCFGALDKNRNCCLGINRLRFFRFNLFFFYVSE